MLEDYLPKEKVKLMADVEGGFKHLMKTAMWGCAAAYRSIKFEVGGMAVARFWSKGSREVVILSTSPILDYLRQNGSHADETLTTSHAVAFVTHCDQKELGDFMQYVKANGSAGAVCFGAIESGQLLYVPAGVVSGERNGPVDNIGVKACLVVPGDEPGTMSLRKMQQESKDFGKQSLALDALLQYIDDWKSSNSRTEREAEGAVQSAA